MKKHVFFFEIEIKFSKNIENNNQYVAYNIKKTVFASPRHTNY